MILLRNPILRAKNVLGHSVKCTQNSKFVNKIFNAPNKSVALFISHGFGVAPLPPVLNTDERVLNDLEVNGANLQDFLQKCLKTFVQDCST